MLKEADADFWKAVAIRIANLFIGGMPQYVFNLICCDIAKKYGYECPPIPLCFLRSPVRNDG